MSDDRTLLASARAMIEAGGQLPSQAELDARWDATQAALTAPSPIARELIDEPLSVGPNPADGSGSALSSAWRRAIAAGISTSVVVVVVVIIVIAVVGRAGSPGPVESDGEVPGEVEGDRPERDGPELAEVAETGLTEVDSSASTADGNRVDDVSLDELGSDDAGSSSEGSERGDGTSERGDAGGDAARSASQARQSSKPLASEAPPRQATQTDATSLAEEVEQLGLARAALSRGDPQAGLAALASYRERFPDGVLRRDAAALRFDALCRAGQVQAAHSQAARYLAAWPTGAAAPRMREGCSEDSGG